LSWARFKLNWIILIISQMVDISRLKCQTVKGTGENERLVWWISGVHHSRLPMNCHKLKLYVVFHTLVSRMSYKTLYFCFLYVVSFMLYPVVLYLVTLYLVFLFLVCCIFYVISCKAVNQSTLYPVVLYLVTLYLEFLFLLFCILTWLFFSCCPQSCAFIHSLHSDQRITDLTKFPSFAALSNDVKRQQFFIFVVDWLK